MSASYQDFFKDKKITLMGLGLLGRGVGDAVFLAKCGADILVTDLKTEEALAESIAALQPYPNVRFALGGHCEDDFTTCDMVIKAAGVPLDSPYIAAAQAAGVPVYMSSALFVHLAEIPFIGVTGTRGKSTITQMIADMLRACGRQVHMGGNIRGVSTLAMLPDIHDGDIAVLELDSWQLQGFRDLKISPHIAVFSNFMQDHMNYYHGDMEGYFFDKAGIFAHQKPEDMLIVGADIFDKIVTEGKPVSQCLTLPALPDDWAMRLPGAHNRENAALALAAVQAFMPDEEQQYQQIWRHCLENFEGIDGRLYYLGESGGVQFYNDNNATTPEALLAALAAFPAGKICLIAGGADKGIDVSALPQKMKDTCRDVVFLMGDGTDRLRGALSDVPVFDSMTEAFARILKNREPGDIVLLSPGFSSFSMYQNEYERSDEFVALVKQYLAEKNAA